MILEKLKRMEGFTHQEQAVARYILDHVEEIQQMSTEELARVSYTSKATVVRPVSYTHLTLPTNREG